MEDSAHERFITGLVWRVASDVGLQIEFDVRNSTGGIPQMRGELSRFLRQYGRIASVPFDTLIVVQDTDCRGVATIRNEIMDEASRAEYPGSVIVAAPDPHIEAWFLADPNSLQILLELEGLPQVPRGDCERNRYKRELSQLFPNSPLGGGLEASGRIVESMDLYRAGQNVPSLGTFIDEIRSSLTQLATTL